MSQFKQLPLIFEFNSSLTFADFYQGKNQEIIIQLKNAISGSGDSLVYLWGSAGYGKSHLLQACCHEAVQIGKRAYFLDLLEYKVSDPELLQGIETYHIVTVDNVDAVAGHDEWELALFHAYNRLREQGVILVVTASCGPKQLAYKLPDLRTRINSGLSLKIQELNDEDKIAALTLKAHRLGMDLTPELARFMVLHHDRRLSALWTMLDILDRESLATKRKLTIPFLKEILG